MSPSVPVPFVLLFPIPIEPFLVPFPIELLFPLKDDMAMDDDFGLPFFFFSVIFMELIIIDDAPMVALPIMVLVALFIIFMALIELLFGESAMVLVALSIMVVMVILGLLLLPLGSTLGS